jgi:hypothetical protein
VSTPVEHGSAPSRGSEHATAGLRRDRLSPGPGRWSWQGRSKPRASDKSASARRRSAELSAHRTAGPDTGRTPDAGRRTPDAGCAHAALRGREAAGRGRGRGRTPAPRRASRSRSRARIRSEAFRRSIGFARSRSSSGSPPRRCSSLWARRSSRSSWDASDSRAPASGSRPVASAIGEECSEVSLSWLCTMVSHVARVTPHRQAPSVSGLPGEPRSRLAPDSTARAGRARRPRGRGRAGGGSRRYSLSRFSTETSRGSTRW